MASNHVLLAPAGDGGRSARQELISSAQALEQAGQHAEARALYESALKLLGPGDGLEASDLVRWIARTHGADGDTEAGIECARLAIAIAEAHGCDRAIARAQNVLGILLQSRGGLDEASFIYRRAEAHAEAAGDVQLVAMVRLNAATIANIRGEFDLALSCYEACLAGFRATGSDAFCSFVLNNLGLLYGDLDRREEAEAALRDALQIAARIGDRTTQAAILVNLADLLVDSGRTDEAERACRDARDLLLEHGQNEMSGEWSKVMGVVERERGGMAEAEAHLHHALERASQRDDLLLTAEVLREQAILYSLQDRNQETLRCLNGSYRLFLQLRARKDIADLQGQLDDLEQTFLGIVRRWGESIEAADLYTQGHCVRVAEYACTLARAAGMDEGTRLWFRMGALLHDVGKIVVPPAVLNKPGGYTPEERMIMERHPDAGVDLLQGIEFPWDIQPMVRFHHERWAGGGYPTGIAGEEIPLSARILAIADVFDALSTDRPYRKALPLEECLETMCGAMKGFFDPDLLRTFLELVSSGQLSPPGRTPSPTATASRQGRECLLVRAASPGSQLAGEAAAALAAEFDCVMLEGRDAPDAVALIAEITGDDPLGELRGIRTAFAGVPVFALLPAEDEALALRLIQAGAEDCLSGTSLDGAAVARQVRRAIERKRFHAEADQETIRDHLTGLYNRRGFFALAEKRINALPADALRPVLVFADLDELKDINDSFGHAEGDRALMEAASVFRSCVRPVDLVARLGGDEFAIVAFPARHELDLDELALRVETEVAARNAAPDRRYALSISLGMAELADGEDVGEALKRADQRMYLFKNARKSGSGSGIAPRRSSFRG
jgi:diguanylate cyclase (GGDEF)-like protein/putative nucleotidyltransferase with HDIG domain